MAKATGSQVVPFDEPPSLLPGDPPQATNAPKAQARRISRKLFHFIFKHLGTAVEVGGKVARKQIVAEQEGFTFFAALCDGPPRA
jgi:hypothetical protein